MISKILLPTKAHGMDRLGFYYFFMFANFRDTTKIKINNDFNNNIQYL